MMSIKVIVVGPVDGQFQDVFKKLDQLHAKNSFSFAIIAGELFREPSSSEADDEQISQLVRGSIKVPLTTYFTVHRSPLPSRVVEKLNSSDGEVCENLCYLGNRTVLSTADGVKIVALGGRLDAGTTAGLTKDRYSPFFTASDLKSLYGANTADILLTSTWPSAIQKGSTVAVPDGTKEPASSDLVSELCAKLKPRYHFSSSEFFFEREPFIHPVATDEPSTTLVTRFISPAHFGNGNKQKWLYAFSIDPKAEQANTMPPGTTVSPFSSMLKRGAPTRSSEFNTRFSSTDRRPPKRARPPPPGPDECYFCLSNPNLAAHLIASIGEESYLTGARGPLPTSSTFDSLRGSTHLLIIPLPHSPRLTDIADTTARLATVTEMDCYRKALQAMVDSQSGGTLGTVTWEVSREKGVHTHWQFLPIGNEMVKKGLVEAAFKVEAENERYPALEMVRKGHLDDMDTEGDCFRLWISGRRTTDVADGASNQIEEIFLRLPIPEDVRFRLQFGRQVMAKLLGLGDRLNWKDCLQSPAEETEDVETFKSSFKPFNF